MSKSTKIADSYNFPGTCLGTQVDELPDLDYSTILLTLIQIRLYRPQKSKSLQVFILWMGEGNAHVLKYSTFIFSIYIEYLYKVTFIHI